jgi:hypothetical protein
MEIKRLSAARLSPPRSRALENILPKRHRNQKRKQKRKRNNTWLLKGSKGGKIGGPKTCWHADRQGASAEGCTSPMGKSKENEMQTNLSTGERFNGLRNGASHTFSSRLRSVIRYPLCVLVSAVAWAFAFNTALLFAIKVHAPDGRIILSRGGCVLFYSWIYPQSGINCDWSCVILLIFLSAAIATTAWHFRKASK